MFQYSFSRYLQIHLAVDAVKMDFSWMEKQGSQMNLTIERFNVLLNKASKSDITHISGFLNPFKPKTIFYKALVAAESLFNRRYYFSKKNHFLSPKTIARYDYFDGYFQDWRYPNQIRNDLIKDFSPKSELPKKVLDILGRIKNENAVFIGVRLGDYLKEQERYGILNETYYNEAISYINAHVENPVFYVFSNDVSKVKSSLKFSAPVIFLSDEVQLSDFEELIIMKNCHHAIIPRSTFHWWAAWLIPSDDKIIVAPQKWFINGEKIDIIPPEWHKL